LPTGWRSACELALVAAFLVGCASAGVSAQRIPFIDHGSTQQSANDGGPLLVVAADNATRTELVRLYPNTPPDPGRVYLGVFAGTQRTGGYAVSVDAVERVADRLNIRSTFTVPPSAAVVIQVITSPAQLVSIARDATTGVREAVLIDQSGAVRARAPVPQSTP